MPGISEMVAMLVSPGHGNTLWQIRVRKGYIGAKYGDVFAALLKESRYPALPLGILRRFPDSPTQGYVWTNPANVRLESSDFIFVLGSAAFGKQMYDEGLLPFSGRSCGDDTPSHWRIGSHGRQSARI